jgi:hypothetical protein
MYEQFNSFRGERKERVKGTREINERKKEDER